MPELLAQIGLLGEANSQPAAGMLRLDEPLGGSLAEIKYPAGRRQAFWKFQLRFPGKYCQAERIANRSQPGAAIAIQRPDFRQALDQPRIVFEASRIDPRALRRGSQDS